MIDSTMNHRSLFIIIVLVTILTFVSCQTINSYCNFNTDGVADCNYIRTSGTNTLTLVTGNIPTGKPNQPLSDVTAVESLTTPNNEPCRFPYLYSPGNWDMYFCRRFNNGTFTCPTASGGSGRCATGRYANIRPQSGQNPYDQTYAANVQTNPNTAQCLDFYYYITDMTSNGKIQAGWKVNADTQLIVEVTAQPENKWHRSRTSFMSPSSSRHDLTFRFMRTGTAFNFNFAIDEIKITDGSCDGSPVTTTPITTTTTKTSTTVTFPTEESSALTLTTEDITTGTSAVTSTEAEPTTTMPPNPNNSALILGLSIGLGTTALLTSVGGVVYFVKRAQLKNKVKVKSSNASNDIPLVSKNEAKNPDIIT